MRVLRASLVTIFLISGCGADSHHPERTGVPDAGNTMGGDDSGTGPNCVGLQCQIASCDNGQDTILTGRVFAPNGTDPVPGAFVYVPNMGLPEFPSTISCDLCGDIGAAAANTKTAYDGTFTLTHVPSGSAIPVVIQLGRFRRVMNIDITPCAQQAAPLDVKVQGQRLPKKDGEMDPNDNVPKIAVATGDWDQIECVLKRMGIEQFDLYEDRDPGQPPPTVGSLSSLLADANKLNGYNILIVNCTDNQFESIVASAGAKKNLEAFVGGGGRLYATDWAYDMVDQVPQFSPFICFQPYGGGGMCTMKPEDPTIADSNDAYNNSAEIVDPDLAEWLTLFPGVIDNTKHVPVQYSFVIVDSLATDMMSFPTKLWVQGMTPLSGTKPMTVTFDYKQCGRVHYSTYNTEPNPQVPDEERFPNCKPDFSPQERILEYLVFEIATCIDNPG
jgi:hypothetical protein